MLSVAGAGFDDLNDGALRFVGLGRFLGAFLGAGGFLDQAKRLDYGFQRFRVDLTQECDPQDTETVWFEELDVAVAEVLHRHG